MRIRSYRPDELETLRRICLLTGNSGRGAQGLYKNESLLGDFWAAPYAVLHPELTFVLADEQADDVAVGYVLGTDDTATFGGRCEDEWFPAIRSKLKMPTDDDESKDAVMIRKIFAGHVRTNEFPNFPAHLHIDLLPEAQSAGWGRRMLDTFVDKLREDGVAGVHLGVGLKNQNAVGFYEHYGFERLTVKDETGYYGLSL